MHVYVYCEVDDAIEDCSLSSEEEERCGKSWWIMDVEVLRMRMRMHPRIKSQNQVALRDILTLY